MRKIIEVKVHTGSSKRKIEIKNGTYHIYTHANPVQGKANKDAIELVADYLGVAKSAVSIIRGVKSKNKAFKINSDT
ncbi:MAG: DUF167 domain-containing protein [Spirochaetota bacterium]|nr:MAG: DUF167 domain-containing protein [Spirochaetota bacterium]